jgi:hypothetical protein
MMDLSGIVENIHAMTWESLHACTYDDIMEIKVIGGARVAKVEDGDVWVSRKTEDSMVLIIRDSDFRHINIPEEAVMKGIKGWVVLCVPNDGFTQLIVEKTYSGLGVVL